MLWGIAVASLVVLAGLSLVVALATPTRWLVGRSRQLLTEAPQSGDQSRQQMEALVPDSDAILRTMPGVDVARLVGSGARIASVSVGLDAIGVADNRQAIERELWLAGKQRLDEQSSR